jgi:hypothetical protein
MKYLREVESAGDKMTFIEEMLRTLPFVKDVKPVESEKKALADIFGKLRNAK